MKIKIGTELNGWAGLVYNQALKRVAASYSPYQPVTINGAQISSGERLHSDRWNVIKQLIQANGAKTLIDLGCAEGYFVERAAKECGCLALGVDADVRRLALAHGSAALNRVHGAGYMYANLTPEFIDALPQYDTVVFMSVLHHIMYEHGVDYSRDYMRRLRPKAARFMVFDMGQSNETENAWAAKLPDMGADPHTWVGNFLKSAGFSKVELVKETDSYDHGSSKRAVFRLVA